MRLKSYDTIKTNLIVSSKSLHILWCAINCYLKMPKYIITEYNSMNYYLHYTIFKYNRIYHRKFLIHF